MTPPLSRDELRVLARLLERLQEHPDCLPNTAQAIRRCRRFTRRLEADLDRRAARLSR